MIVHYLPEILTGRHNVWTQQAASAYPPEPSEKKTNWTWLWNIVPECEQSPGVHHKVVPLP